MKTHLLAWCGALTLGVAVAPLSHSETPATAAEEQLIVYKFPPDPGPSLRIDARVRGAPGDSPALYMLAPPHAGLTTKAQPSIFWYLSKPVQTRVELAIVQEKKIIPIFDVKVGDAGKAGVQRFRLADHHIKLEPGIEYRCSVALVLNEESRSKDVVASCVVKRIEPLSSLKARLADARPSEAAFIYASEGIWFDAMESLAELIEANPDNGKFRRQRSALLDQVQLADAAAYDAKLASNK